MSQAGIVDFIGTHPEIPTLFVANVGTAIPIANTIEILGEAVTAHGVPLQTVASGNTININVQYASAAASSVAGNAGVASFNSTFFSVDANGFVTFNGSAGTESFTVDAATAPGTNPVIPNGSGNITVTGGQVAAGTTANVIRTNSLAANTYTIQIQRSQAVGSSTVGDNGVSHFNSTFFTVDANGFVSASGTGLGQTITGQSGGALSPTGGNWNLFGAGSISTVGSGSTLTVELTGLTNHAVQVGGSGTTLTQIGPSATTGAIFASNGASADPSFQNAAGLGASLVLISSQSASNSANISFTGLTTYTNYLLVWRSVWAATATDTLQLLFSTNNGSSYLNSTYFGGINYNAYNSVIPSNANSTAFMPLSGPNDANVNNSGFLYLFDINSGDTACINGNVTYTDSTLATVTFGSIGGKCTTTAINALRIQMSTGNMTIGTFDLYGIRES